MKIPQSDRQRGFTLVELLVVIAIIAVLAAAGFAAGNAAIERARRLTAQASCTAIESAVNNFFTDYGSMPIDATANPSVGDITVRTSFDDQNGIALLNVLLGKDKTINTRGLNFLSVKEGKGKKNGLIYNRNTNAVEGLYDPWGGPYYVMMDNDYDEIVEPMTQANRAKKTLNGRRVAVWTDGADWKSKSPKAKDDVTTW